ncbi:MAG: hypothetical protein QOG94_2886 [Solirubrobacteraceae bacterium]|nr:hypothetical protein [Solirubrobacteraceae bacterium]
MRTDWSRAAFVALISTLALGAASATASASLVVTRVVDLPAGASPGRVAVDSATGNVYVADGGGRVLSYTNDLGGALPDISTGPGAYGLAVDPRPASHRLFVARFPGAIEVHALASGATLCAYGGAGAGLDEVAFNPATEKAYVAAESPPNIAVSASPGNCSITKNIFTDDKPLDVAVDTTANRVYGAIHHANELAVVDGSTDTLLSQIGVLAGNPFGVAVDSVNHRVYVAENLGNQIVMLDSGPTGTGPYGQMNLPIGDAPAFVATDPGLDAAYVGIRNFLELGVIVHGVVQSPIALGFIPGKPAVDLASHCVYVAGPASPNAKLARLCPAGAAEIAADHPLAWYRLGEPSGSAMLDSSGGAHDGACVNGVTFGLPGALSGDASTARGFDGRAAYCYVNGITAPTSAYTIEGWMKLSAPVSGTIADHGSAGAIYVQADRYCMRNAWESLCTPAGAPAPTVGAWHHVAATWSAPSTVARLYVDGTLVASAPNGARPSGSSTFYVGYGQSAPWFTGTLDEIAYYPTALSAARIAAHYHAGCGC